MLCGVFFVSLVFAPLKAILHHYHNKKEAGKLPTSFAIVLALLLCEVLVEERNRLQAFVELCKSETLVWRVDCIF